MNNVVSNSGLSGLSAEQFLMLLQNPDLANLLSKVTDQSAQRREMAVRGKDVWSTTYTQLANPNIYGRYSIFDPCFAGDAFGLQVQTNGLLNWLGWRKNPYYKRSVQFVTWWRGEGAEDGLTGAGSPCEDPTSWEWGECGYDLCHLSWYHRQGKPLGPHDTQIACETSPKYRINGTLITDNFEWQLNGVLNTLKQDLAHDVVHGSHLNTWEMNGLESIIRQGYADNNGNLCPMVDSWLVQWAFDDLNGAVNGWGNFFDFLNELVNQVEYRASPIGDIAETDMVLFTARFMADCILDAFACYSVCGLTSYGDITDQALRSQVLLYRQGLNGGPLYDGTKVVGSIKLKNGRKIGLMVDDSFTITKPSANYCVDVYLLTRKIGPNDVLYGEYLDLTSFENQMKKFNPATGVRVEAGGRFAFKGKEDNWCGVAMAGTSPEIYIAAPWAQARVMNVCCDRKFKPITGDPFQPDYLPGGKIMYDPGAWGITCTDVPTSGTPVTPGRQQ